MELYTLIALAIAAGWVAWKIKGPKVQLEIRWANGELDVHGQVSPHQRQEFQEFFASQFEDASSIQVTILAPSPSRPTRSRIQIRGVASESESQQIRNFLTSRL